MELSRAAELSEAEALWDMADGVEPELVDRLGLAGLRVGGGVVRAVRNDPLGGFWNRSLGLGLSEPLTAEVLDEAIAFCRDAGAPLMVFQLAPHLAEGDWPELAESRGIEPSAAWVKFMGPPPEIPDVETDLRIGVLGPEHAEEMARIAITSFGMPDGPMAEWVADMARRWTSYGAWDGDTLVGYGQMFVHGTWAHLFGAGTLPEARGRGAQSALMKARVDEAVRRGCTLVGTETGTETPEDPNPSLHNMRRLGFTELYERRNWVWRP